MKKSAGILLYRKTASGFLFFLVHPGGPFFKNKDLGSWSIPKGEFEDDEDPLTAAIREFHEETGTLLSGDFIALDPVKLKSGKKIFAWAMEGDVDVKTVVSNDFELEWPPRSGRKVSFPEIDKAEWFDESQALGKLNVAQGDLIRQLMEIRGVPSLRSG
ncbi:MAG: NUDIX domain-containing protein [Bacteroidota bacterium]